MLSELQALQAKGEYMAPLFAEIANYLYNQALKRVKRSHHIFRKFGVEEKLNLQKDGNKAKLYQVKQVRNIILKYKLGVDKDV